MATPAIKSARIAGTYRICDGFYRAELLEGVQSPDPAEYLFVLRVFDEVMMPGEPEMYVTSAPTTDPDDARLGSHTLTVFRAGRKVSFGPHDDWSNRERFVERALEIAKKPLCFLRDETPVAEGGVA